jgi:penicillin-insensitive murein endopeptidase
MLVAPLTWSGPPAQSGHVHGAILRHSRSVGSPTSGRLLNGAHLNDAPYLRVVPAYQAGDARWGTEALVGMLDRAARQVRRQFPDAVMSVGHLSRPGGGEIERHHSHESGRDADIAFYVKSYTGKPAYADHFVAFQGDGTAPTWPGAHFDDARNWAFVAALLGDPVAHVSHIFVATPLRARLLAYAERMGVAAPLRQRAAEVMAQPRGSLPHDDHFHVRISCPPEMTTGADRCIEDPMLPAPSRIARAAHAAHPAHAAPAHAPAHPAPAPPHAPPRPPTAQPPALPAPALPDPQAASILVPASPQPAHEGPVDDVDGIVGDK